MVCDINDTSSSIDNLLFLRYSWCSSRLIDEEFRLKSNVELNDMIPMESDPSIPSLIIGHNVAFDRTYIKEQYQIEVKIIKQSIRI